jgi:WXG100 family type VII secretion target
MSASEVRANYEELTGIANTFLKASERNQQSLQQVERTAQRLTSQSWQGRGSDAFAREMQSLLLPGLRRLVAALAQGGTTVRKIQTLMREAEEEAAALFNGQAQGPGMGGGPGDGSAQAGDGSGAGAGTGGTPPQMTMADLFKSVAGGNDAKDKNSPYNPVTIKQIGDNEYVVEIAGTKADSWWGNNGWISALVTGFSPSSPYYNDVRAMVDKLPPGATIHLAGHSQGGHDALFLAQDKGLLDKYNIATVTTFGTSTIHKEYNNESQYHNYMIKTDVLGIVHDGVYGTIEGVVAPIISPLTRMDDVRNTYLSPLHWNPVQSHGDYGDHPDMKAIGTPFTIKQPPVVVDQMTLPGVNTNSPKSWWDRFWNG